MKTSRTMFTSRTGRCWPVGSESSPQCAPSQPDGLEQGTPVALAVPGLLGAGDVRPFSPR